MTSLFAEKVEFWPQGEYRSIKTLEAKRFRSRASFCDISSYLSVCRSLSLVQRGSIKPVDAMSEISVYVDNSAPPLERRLHARNSLSALADLDIGANNGGIVPELERRWYRISGRWPLDGQGDLSLRIQLPHSQTRIETAAKIVWLSDSNRQAGCISSTSLRKCALNARKLSSPTHDGFRSILSRQKLDAMFQAATSTRSP
jgi:hypothetical protein